MKLSEIITLKETKEKSFADIFTSAAHKQVCCVCLTIQSGLPKIFCNYQVR